MYIYFLYTFLYTYFLKNSNFLIKFILLYVFIVTNVYQKR